jgi:hypothetical protein
MLLNPRNIRDSELEDILVESYKSTKLFAQVFFPDRFNVAFSRLHEEIFDLIDSGERRIAIAAPRGLGKTSMVALAYMAKNILFQDQHFIPYVNMSFMAASLQTENLKRELITNQLVRKLFGSVKTGSANLEGIDETFSKAAWVARVTDNKHGCLVLPRGSGQQIRGVLYIDYRPGLIIIDDLEDPETIGNEEIRNKREVWFHGDLMKAVSRVDNNWRIIYIDTIKHEDSLLEKLLEASDWATLRQEFCNDELESNCPEFMSNETLKAEHKSHKEKGILDVFYREFRNIPISKEDAVFRQEHFKSYRDDFDRLVINPNSDKPEIIPASKVLNIVLVDPAKTVKLNSAESAIGCIGVSRVDKKIFLRDVVARKMEPDELYEEMFSMVKRYNAFILGVEVTSLHRFISQPIENEMRVRSIFPLYVEMPARGKKEERVAKLAPLYRLGYIYHNESCSSGIESQLMGFPRSKRWDIMDMFSYIIYIMDEQAVYFDPDDFTENEEEYTDVMEDNEEPLKFRWAN